MTGQFPYLSNAISCVLDKSINHEMYITKSLSIKQLPTVFTVHCIYWHSTFTDFVF